jgi:spectinomycin phosphotransferase
VREPPPHVSDDAVLCAIRASWPAPVDWVEHLPVGFGAHHWRASVTGRPTYFVTFDGLLPRHTADSLESAYAAAAELAVNLDFVVAPLTASTGRHTLPFADGALSVTLWVDGPVAGDGSFVLRADAEVSAAQLAKLHALRPPLRTPRWSPLVPDDFAETLAERLSSAWDVGPFGEQARSALLARTSAIRDWTASYHRLGGEAHTRDWVATHGEPHTRNQVVTPTGPLLVDWESIKLAPRERDLRPLVDSGFADLAAPDWPMMELFDLEWRLDEVAQYADWFRAPHTGTASDEVAFGGLVSELERPEWRWP